MRLRAALAAFGLRSWTEHDLVREAGVPLGELSGHLAALTQDGALIELAISARRSLWLPAETVAALEDRVLRVLKRLHDERPRQSAVRRSQVAARFPDVPEEALVAVLIERLQARGAVVGDAQTVALAGHQPVLTQAERKLMAELLAALCAGGISPPDLTELGKLAGTRAGVMPELLAILAAEGRIVEVGGGIFLDAQVENELQRRVVERLADGVALTMADLRDLLGTTRKYAVPIGEYLDRIGLTRREGDARRLARAAQEPAP